MSIGLPEEANPLKDPPSPGRAGILVVDEDPAFQLGLKTFLKEYVGFDEVFAARSGPDALALIEAEDSIDVITLDYQMPGMNGIEFLEQLSLSPPRSLSVLMITGYPSEELETQFRSFASSSLLVNHFLPKPIEFEKLEPLVLKAHEELLAARLAEAEKAREEENEILEIQEDDLPKLEDGVESALSRQEAKIDALTEKVRVLRSKSRRDSCLLGLLILFMGVALHFGWFSSLETGWGKVKEDFQALLPAPSEPESSPPTDGPPDTSPPLESAPGDAPL
ncbi:MAG: response regulator [Verrucomicrobiota bacterium]